jgi:hypothetical protein
VALCQKTKIETTKKPDFISRKVYDVFHNEIIAQPLYTILKKQKMKSLSIFFLFITIGITANAQNLDNKFYKVNSDNPIVIINGEIMAGFDMLKKLPTDHISEMNVLKNQEISSKNLFPVGKQANGIIEIKIDYQFDIKTQKELNVFFGLNPSNDIYLNGYLIENKNRSISRESIKKIELMKANDISLKASALNITI